MTSSRTLPFPVLSACFLALLSVGHATAQGKKVQVEVCVLDDQGKNVEGVRVYINPLGKGDPPMQTTTRERCLRFEFDVTPSFDIAFSDNGQIIGVLRGMAGFNSRIVDVNYRRLSIENKENPALWLASIRSYTATLRARPSVQPEVIDLLRSPAFQKQVDAIATSSGDTTPRALRGDIMNNVSKLRGR